MFILGSTFPLNVRIFCFPLTCMTVNEESLDECEGITTSFLIFGRTVPLNLRISCFSLPFMTVNKYVKLNFSYNIQHVFLISN